MKNIADNLPSFENNHITLLINQFIIKYILNAPPNMYNIVSFFIESLLVHCNNRLVVGWSAPAPLTTNRLLHCDDNNNNTNIHNINSSNSSNIEVYYYNIYKLCSIPNTQGNTSNIHGINNDIIELVRERIISTFTRTLSDLLSSLACLQGPLAEKPSTSTTTTTTGICIYIYIPTKYILCMHIYIHMCIYTGTSGTGGESENMEPNNGGAPILPSSLKKSNKGKSKRKLIISTPAVVGLPGGGDGEGSLAGSDKLLEVNSMYMCSIYECIYILLLYILFT